MEEQETRFLYVIAESADGPVKIGVANNPEKRLSQLQTGSSGELRLFHSEPCEADKASEVERRIHQELRPHRKKGEWFSIAVEQAVFEVTHGRIRWEADEEVEMLVRRRRFLTSMRDGGKK